VWVWTSYNGCSPNVKLQAEKKLASIELSQLESHLWEAANILRGAVDAADFKTYVFPLLFFKRISDVTAVRLKQCAPAVSDGPAMS
jgi:type I restriction-modification system DNA methylase subunit